jgi:GST-like protein
MTDLSSFPITQRWPASYPDRLQLYAAPTPNGVKVSMMLEETGLPYEPHFVDISNNESKDPAFVSLNPKRMPAIIDPAGPDGQPIGIWETGAILIYLADKTGQLISTTRPAVRDSGTGVLSGVGRWADLRTTRLFPAICRQGL